MMGIQKNNCEHKKGEQCIHKPQDNNKEVVNKIKK